ncbi:pilus assembly protein PilP [Aestuariibacter sp. A3R04]|uniref:pilus assembly protein PilP n=1 Tax=Aestuariibacter sp. A3R04 TaxID=2841571 RepID=UPI001C0902EC|nr:pilus assembly protein PilP [Aestuariibacter sp. A3R04]MBU3020802.1 pilus assembly protein PilP [Aestuariibacter sp. A3R04]
MIHANLRIVMILVIGLLSSGCAPKIDDLVAYTAQVKATTSVQVDPYPEFKSQPAFKYDASSFRSPFARPQDRTSPVVAATRNNCIQPDFDRKKEKLEKYGLDSLTLSGTFSTQGVRWVLFKTTEGALLKARKGNHVGLFYGEITHIGDDAIIIEQLLPDGAGCWQREKTTLMMNTSAGDNKNV